MKKIRNFLASSPIAVGGSDKRTPERPWVKPGLSENLLLQARLDSVIVDY